MLLSPLALFNLQLRMACKETSALHLVATRLESIFLRNSCRQVALVILFRDFDGHVLAIVLNDGENEFPFSLLIAYIIL